MTKYLKENFIYLFLVFIASTSFFGALVYYFYSLNKAGIILSTTLSIPFFSIITYLHYKKYRRENKNNYFSGNKNNGSKNFLNIKFDLFLLFSYLSLAGICLLILFYNQTASSIISPWQIVPKYFFAFYVLSTLVLIFSIIKNSRFSLFLISAQAFLSFSIAWIIYKIGYGFDPLIHEATMDLINKTGAVYPKNFYYLGQYSLIIIIHKIFYIPIYWLNKLLVPVLVAIIIPFSFFIFLKQQFENRKTNLLLIATLFIFPYSAFIATTPQNLSYIFLIALVFLGLSCKTLLELTIIFLLSLTTLFIHPISGIPAVFFSLLIIIFHSDLKRSKKYLYGLAYSGAAIALPAAFLLVNLKNTNAEQAEKISETGPSIFNLALENLLKMPREQNFILNFLYLHIFNISLLIIILALAGIFILIKYRKKCRIFFINLGMVIALIVSYLMVSKINFSFIIDYERSDYAGRILALIFIFLLPIIILPLYSLINKVSEQKKAVKIPFLIFLVLLIASSLYASYPRFDDYFNSRGYSVGENDFKAVEWIEENRDQNYMVLANQQVSAAALSKFGFNRYLKDEIYFYPIPTGGTLYKYYLKMVYESADRQTMLRAMDETDVDEAYFVINKYWWAFDKILSEAKLSADSWQEIGNGDIYIFKYSR